MTDSVKTVGIGYSHTLIVKLDGTLYGAGTNNLGQLGNGKSGSEEFGLPKIMGDVEAVACGNEFSYVLKKDRTLWSAGHNYGGYTGEGAGALNNAKKEFTKILANVKSLTAGQNYAMVIQTNGFLKGTGSNYNGQFGHKKKYDASFFVLIEK